MSEDVSKACCVTVEFTWMLLSILQVAIFVTSRNDFFTMCATIVQMAGATIFPLCSRPSVVAPDLTLNARGLGRHPEKG